MFDEDRAAPLDGIAAGLALRLARIPIGCCFCRGDAAHRHGSVAQCLHDIVDARYQGHRRHHAVGATRKCRQHAQPIDAVSGFAEHDPIHHHHRIGTEHRLPAAAAAQASMCLCQRQPHCQLRRCFTGQRSLVDIHCQHLMGHTQLLQQFAATRRRGGEHDRCEFEGVHSRW